jgi:SpoIID/LytB domain protein
MHNLDGVMGKTRKSSTNEKRYKLPILILVFFFLIIPKAFCENDLLARAHRFWWEGSYSEAIPLYKKAAQNTRDETLARTNLAALFRSLGYYQPAIQQYRILLSGNRPMDRKAIEEVLIPLAESYYYAHMLKEAELTFHKVLEVTPSSLRALFGLGRVLFAEGKYDKSEALFQKSASLNPQFPAHYIYLARIAQKKKDSKGAATLYKEALQWDNYQVELMYFLGLEHQALGQYEEAFRRFYRLNNIDAGNTFVKAKLKEVRQHLTRKEEEIIVAKKLERFFLIEPAALPLKIPVIRIGLNTSVGGRILPMKALSFVSNGSFTVDSANRTLFSGGAHKQYTIAFQEGRAVLTGSSGDALAVLPGKFLLKQMVPARGSFIIRRIEYAQGFAWGGIEDRQYRGRIEVNVTRDGFRLINEVNLEEYLYGVVPSEMMISFPLEALKVQSIIARSYALYRMNYIHPHKDHGFDLCDSQHCQVYKGASNEWEKSSRAIDQTRGIVLMHRGEVAQPLYHSNCGGHTQSSADLKGWGEVDYLKGVFDGPESVTFPSSPVALERWLKSQPSVYCNIKAAEHDPEFRWFRMVPAEFLQEKILRQKDIGNIKRLFILSRNPSGYVHSVKIIGTEGYIIIEKEHLIRRLLGIGPLRSNLFWVETKYDGQSVPEEFIFFGGGWGHGVGMCQSGAAGMAQKGFSFSQILSHYYINTEVKTLDY